MAKTTANVVERTPVLFPEMLRARLRSRPECAGSLMPPRDPRWLISSEKVSSTRSSLGSSTLRVACLTGRLSSSLAGRGSSSGPQSPSGCRTETLTLRGSTHRPKELSIRVGSSASQGLNAVSVAFLGVCWLLVLGAGCTSVPNGVAVDDSDVKALLRPTRPITEEALVQGEDGKLYYSATLGRKPDSDFRESYLADLEERGFHFEVERSSPHLPVSRVTGYSVSIVQEASPTPYTIRYKQARDGDPKRRSGMSLFRGDYPSPVRVSGRRLVFRLGRHFLDPWRSVVVVPEADMQELPFEMPRPEGAIVRAVEPRTVTPISDKGSPEQPYLERVEVYFVTKRPAAEILEFYRLALSPWASLFQKRPEEFSFKFGDRLPPWAPKEIDFLAGSLDNFLYAKDGIAIARYSPERYAVPPLPGDAPRWKALKNLPKDVSVMRVTVKFKRRSGGR
jgi:hypothetical protein